jgi:hypothetical protein
LTYTAGALIEHTDLQSIIGPFSSDQAYPNLGSTNLSLGALWGVGYGTIGLGQGFPKLILPAAGDTVTSRDWSNIRSALGKLAAHQGSSISLPAESTVEAGSIITASGVDWTAPLSIVQQNSGLRDTLTFDSTNLKSTSRSDPWNTSLVFEARCYFGTEDTARYFFNAFSEIRVSASVANGTTASAVEWANTLTAMGSISLGANTITQTGSGGNLSPLGFWTIGTNYQTVFSQNLQGPFSSDSISLEARVAEVAGTNGGNGAVIDLRLNFNLLSSNTVDGVVSANISAFTADGSNIVVALPLVIATSQLDGTQPPSLYLWTNSLGSQETDFNLATAAESDGWDGSQPLFARLIVNNTGRLLGSQPNSPALVVPQLPANSQVLITVEPQAVVAGRGGGGGTGAPSSFCGCEPGQDGGSGGPAFWLGTPAMVHNFGTIGGGGGGGGGGGAECTVGWRASAGGGGGGAGFGTGGTSNPCGVTEGRTGGTGQAGSLLLGGDGGSRGNPFTAQGGRGGDLGMPGSPGQSLSALGGAGGFAGVGLSESFYLLPGSVLGDIRGAVT